MSSRRARFEVVRTDAGWLGRYIARNGKEVWRTSETYQRRHAAVMAIDHFGFYRGGRTAVINGFPVEVREVDER